MIKTKNLLLKNIQNENTFFDILLSIPNNDYLKKILILLKQEQELDFFLLASKAIKNDYEVFKLQLLLDKLVFVSILNINTLLDLYNSLSSLHYEYITLSITEKLSNTSTKFSLKLYENMIKEKKEFMISHISILFLSIYKNKNQYKEIKKLFEYENIFLTQSAIEIVSFIKLSDKEAKEIFYIFTKLLKIKNMNLDKNIISSSNKMKDENSDFEDILELYSEDIRLEIKYSISKILLLNKSKDLEKDWFKTCLFSLSSINNYDKDILRNISFILNNIINEKQDYKIIREFFDKARKESEIKIFKNKDLMKILSDLKEKEEKQD